VFPPLVTPVGAAPNVSGGPRVTEPPLRPRVMADDTLSPILTAVAPRPTLTVPKALVPVFPTLTVVAAALLLPILVTDEALGPIATFPLPVAPLNASCVFACAYAVSSVTLHTLPPLSPHIHYTYYSHPSVTVSPPFAVSPDLVPDPSVLPLL
jgi:hypothetical protein